MAMKLLMPTTTRAEPKLKPHLLFWKIEVRTLAASPLQHLNGFSNFPTCPTTTIELHIFSLFLLEPALRLVWFALYESPLRMKCKA